MTATDMRDLADQLRRRLGPAWAQVVAYLREHNALDDVAAAISAGRYDEAIAGIVEAAQHYANNLGAAYKIAARATAGWAETEIDQLVNFDETNHAAVAAIREVQQLKLREVSEETKQTVRAMIEDGVANGDNPRVIAMDVRNAVGLTEYQARIVANFRRELEDGDWTAAGSRELIDGRWARTFARLNEKGGGLSQAEIDRVTAKYSDNWVAFRAESIARTQGLQAAHGGYDVAMRQVVESGKAAAEDFTRKWNHGPHRKFSREFHESMHGQERGLFEPFVSGHGVSLMYPCDPDAPAEEIIRCTCVVSTRYKPPTPGERAAAMRGGRVVLGGFGQ